MSLDHLTDIEFDETNPLDVIEMTLDMKDWAMDRVSNEEMKARIVGKWCDYKVFMEWHHNHRVLECTFWPSGLFFDAADFSEVSEFLTRINEQLWLGHFIFCNDSQTVLFKHSFLLGQAGSISPEQIQDVFDLARLAYDRFYPFLKLLAQGERDMSDTISVAMMDVAGEA